MNGNDIFIIGKNLTAKKVAEVLGGEILCGAPEAEINNVQFDSRAVCEGSLFVPIKGEKEKRSMAISLLRTVCKREQVPL